MSATFTPTISSQPYLPEPPPVSQTISSTAAAGGKSGSGSSAIWWILGVLAIGGIITAIVLYFTGVFNSSSGGGTTGTGTGTRTGTSTSAGTGTSFTTGTGTGTSFNTGTNTSIGTATATRTGTSTGTSSQSLLINGGVRINGLYLNSEAIGSTSTVQACSTQVWQFNGVLLNGGLTGNGSFFNRTKNVYLSASDDGNSVTMTTSSTLTPQNNFKISLGNGTGTAIDLGKIQTNANRYLTLSGSTLVQTSTQASGVNFVMGIPPCPSPDYTIGISGYRLHAPTLAEGSVPYFVADSGAILPQEIWKFPDALYGKSTGTGTGTGVGPVGAIYIYNVATTRYITVQPPSGFDTVLMNYKDPEGESMLSESFVREPGTLPFERFRTIYDKYLQSAGFIIDGDGASNSGASLFNITQVGSS